MPITQNFETLKGGGLNKSNDWGHSYLIVVMYSFLAKATWDFYLVGNLLQKN